MKELIKKAIQETLVVENKVSLDRCVDKIMLIIDSEKKPNVELQIGKGFENIRKF